MPRHTWELHYLHNGLQMLNRFDMPGLNRGPVRFDSPSTLSLPLKQRLARAGAPAAWPHLGSHAISRGR